MNWVTTFQVRRQTLKKSSLRPDTWEISQGSGVLNPLHGVYPEGDLRHKECAVLHMCGIRYFALRKEQDPDEYI
jgi:hypothetical protein